MAFNCYDDLFLAPIVNILVALEVVDNQPDFDISMKDLRVYYTWRNR